MLVFFVSQPSSSASGNEVLGTNNQSSPVYTDKLLASTADEINTLRQSQGLTKLAQSTSLDDIAEARATDMAKNGYYSHLDSEGRYFDDLMKERGLAYSFACENLNTAEVSTPQNYIDSWLASNAHKDCMMQDSHTQAGYAIATISSVEGIPLNQQVIVAIYSN